MTAQSTALTTTTGDHGAVAATGAAGHAQGGISNVILGMLLFITSEVMFFGGLFAAYFSIRASAAQWPPINPETNEAFHLQVLPVVTTDGVTSYSFVLIATVLLVLSSVSCQYAVWKIRSDDSVAVCQAWNQIPILKRRCWKAVQQ